MARRRRRATRRAARGDDAGRSAPTQARHRAAHARPGRLYARRCERTSWCSASARPAPARPISRSPPRWRCSSAGQVERIILSRPAVEAGERLGFLPGDMKEKVDPYLRPLYDALLRHAAGATQVARELHRAARSRSRRSPSCAAARWRTAFVILDEAQNTTPTQMKMFLTRLGEGTRAWW